MLANLKRGMAITISAGIMKLVRRTFKAGPGCMEWEEWEVLYRNQGKWSPGIARFDPLCARQLTAEELSHVESNGLDGRHEFSEDLGGCELCGASH